jgi:hypothetical protein
MSSSPSKEQPQQVQHPASSAEMTDAFVRDDSDEVLKLVINGESVNCVCATENDATPIMCALWIGRIDFAIELMLP